METLWPGAGAPEGETRPDSAEQTGVVQQQPEAPDLAAPAVEDRPDLPRANPALDISEAAHRLADLVEQARAAGFAVTLPCSPAALRGVAVSETDKVS